MTGSGSIAGIIIRVDAARVFLGLTPSLYQCVSDHRIDSSSAFILL